MTTWLRFRAWFARAVLRRRNFEVVLLGLAPPDKSDPDQCVTHRLRGAVRVGRTLTLRFRPTFPFVWNSLQSPRRIAANFLITHARVNEELLLVDELPLDRCRIPETPRTLGKDDELVIEVRPIQ